MRPALVIIGGGTLGLYLASRMSSACNVVVLEAAAGQVAKDDLLLGRRRRLGSHLGSTSGWASALGGTSTIWGGQLLPWETWEFTGGRGRPPWPFGLETLSRHYGAVLDNLGLSETHRRIHNHGHQKAPLKDSQAFHLRYSTWMTRTERDFSKNRTLKRGLAATRVITGAVADRVDSVGGGFVTHYEDRLGERQSIESQLVIYAAGTLGNVRLLTRSLQAHDRTLVGKGFMDHVSSRVYEFRAADWERFRRVSNHRITRGVRSSPKLVANPEFAESHGGIPGYAHWEFDASHSALLSFAKARGLSAPTPQLAAEMGKAVSAVVRGAVHHERPLPSFVRPYLRVDVEQPPRSDRSLSWVDDDQGGHMEIEWGVSDEERASLRVIGEHAVSYLEDAGIGASADSRPEPLEPIDTKHLMGGAAMHSDARLGVTDLFGEVHGQPGSWVIGASVFPSGGVANPTFTALALADRTAQRITEYVA